MNCLLDTHILLWALTGDERLPQKALEIICNPENVIYYSFANVWELAIKHAMKKPDIPISPERFDTLCIEAGYRRLAARHEHTFLLQTLKYDKHNAPREHRDPFDRLLLVQAKYENMRFVTHDELIPYYNEPCVEAV